MIAANGVPESPYRGLEPFDERDAPFFFGREREARLITASLFAAPLTLLYGASGVGKSSVLRAGVLPRLRLRSDLLPVVFPVIVPEREGPSPSVVLFGWQLAPVEGIRIAVARAMAASAKSDPDLSARCEEAVKRVGSYPLREYLAACHEACGRRIMVILDQFEEYSLYHSEDDAFAQQFSAAVAIRDLSVSFVVSMREDALARLDRFKGRIPNLWDSYRRVDHLDRAAAEDAIRLPLREYNRRHPGITPVGIEDSLVEAVLRDVQTESVQFEDTGSGTLGGADRGSEARIETPYLQLVMMRLWEREQAEGSALLRSSTLADEGGAAEVVRTHLDRVMEQFTGEERDIAARIFHRLVTPSGAKIAFSAADLAQYETIEPERLAPILQRLEEGSRRILRRVASRSGAADEPRYEIFHDRLGKAILAWRAKRLQEQERDRKQREEAEQKRLAAETLGRYRAKIYAAVNQLGAQGMAVCARMMSYLVTTDGRRMPQTASELARLSQQPRDSVVWVLENLREAGLLRFVDWLGAEEGEDVYEVAQDGLALGLLEWQSRFVESQARAASKDPLRNLVAAKPAIEPTPPKKFPYRLIRQALREGGVVPFLGAGASMSSTPPERPSRGDVPWLIAAREMKEVLARECSFPPGAFEASDVSEITSFYVHRFGRERLDDRLHEMLGRPEFRPSETHRLLAEVAQRTPLVILTTNYDTLMEKALDEQGRAYFVVAYVPQGSSGFVIYSKEKPAQPLAIRRDPRDNLAGIPPKVEETLVVRLHGPAFPLGKRLGSYVVTEEDQIDWLTMVYAPETSRRSIPPFVLEMLATSHLLSLGHSARDWTQRAMLRTLMDRPGSHPRSMAVALNPSHMSITTWQRYDVDLYNLDLKEWAARMRESGAA